ncbi:MAG: hypothetical protein LBK58_11795 [Prevotellaceae bacterium]|nr:hypothetical protein [Prevotellaceae bacterium]
MLSLSGTFLSPIEKTTGFDFEFDVPNRNTAVIDRIIAIADRNIPYNKCNILFLKRMTAVLNSLNRGCGQKYHGRQTEFPIHRPEYRVA